MKRSSKPRSPADVEMGRREFLLALGGGLPLLAQSCGEPEPTHLRDAELAAGEPLIEPLPILPQTVPAEVASLSIEVIRSLDNTPVAEDEWLCSVPKSFSGVIAVGDQVRITRKSSQRALYTVAELRKADNPDDVRLCLAGRLRLGTSETFSGTLRIPVVAEGLTDAEAMEKNEFVERLVDDGHNTGLIVLAPHGGAIEANTDRQAVRVRTKLAQFEPSSWICKGWKAGGGAYERWHVTSTAISPRSFPRLATIANRGFAHAVSFHGMKSGGVLIGGNAPLVLKKKLRQAIIAAIEDPDVSVAVATAMDQYNGDSPDNIVNWLTEDGEGGIQIEQDMYVRIEYWREIADAVVSVFQQML